MQEKVIREKHIQTPKEREEKEIYGGGGGVKWEKPNDNYTYQILIKETRVIRWNVERWKGEEECQRFKISLQ